MADGTVTQILKGKETNISVRFVRNGTPVSFPLAPRWQLLNDEATVILSGTAVAGTSPGEWVATITIPEDYEPLSGNRDELMLLDVFGTDSNRKERSAERELQMIDYAEDFLPDGITWFKGQQLIDTILTSKPIIALSAQIQDAAGTIIMSYPALIPVSSRQVRGQSSVPDKLNLGSKSLTQYHSTVNLTTFSLPFSSVPYLIYYNVTTADGAEQVVTQLYWTNNRIVNIAMRAKNYLDKARLTEIDPTMQWWDTEYFAATYEGLQYVNGHAPEITFWTQQDLPMPLEQYWMYASIFHMLNTRYLAEGMTKFNFTGLNTTLDVDRTEALQYKMDEIKGILDNLTVAKVSAIRTSGTGTVDPTTGVTAGRNAVAVLGLSINPTNNVNMRGRLNRGLRFR